MEYQVDFRPQAEEDLSRLDKEIAQRVLSRIRWLAQHFEEIKVESLTGKQWKGVFKLRVGDYRVLLQCQPPKKAHHYPLNRP